MTRIRSPLDGRYVVLNADAVPRLDPMMRWNELASFTKRGLARTGAISICSQKESAAENILGCIRGIGWAFGEED